MRRLAIRPGGIGDFILSLPALERLAADYFEVWASTANVPLARFAHRARSIALTSLDLLGVVAPPARLIEDLRSFDSIVSWYGAGREEFRATVDSLGLPFTFFPARPAEGAGVHAVDFYLEQARTLAGSSGAPAGPRARALLGRPARAPRAGDGIPRIPCQGPRHGCAVIHPFSGSPRKNWPLEKFQALASRLERIMPVRWCAGPDDPALENLLAASAPGARVVRIDDLYELARWLAGARLYIGNDSGITHLAAAAGAPVLALFGPTDPAVWAPCGANVRVAQWTQ